MLAGVIYLVFLVRYSVSIDRLQTEIEKKKGNFLTYLSSFAL